jgi:hypothetical protein
MSETAVPAAATASMALTCGPCTGCAPPLGSNASTRVSQNAARNKKNMTLSRIVRGGSCLPHDGR